MSSTEALLREAVALGVVTVDAGQGGYVVSLRGRSENVGVDITLGRPSLGAALEAVIELARKWMLRRD